MLPDSLRKIFLAITLLNLDRKRSLGQTLFSVLSPEGTQGNCRPSGCGRFAEFVMAEFQRFSFSGGKSAVKNGAKGMSDMAG